MILTRSEADKGQSEEHDEGFHVVEVVVSENWSSTFRIEDVRLSDLIFGLFPPQATVGWFGQGNAHKFSFMLCTHIIRVEEEEEQHVRSTGPAGRNTASAAFNDSPRG